jgi:hypothetical protein
MEVSLPRCRYRTDVAAHRPSKSSSDSFLVLPKKLFHEPEILIGWGALIESDGELILVRKPVWHDVTPEHNLRLLERIARAATRTLNQQFGINSDAVSV